MDAGRHAAAELQEAAGRRELERREGESARAKVSASPGAKGVRQRAAGGADAATGRAELPGRPGTKRLLWVSNTESDVFRMGQSGTVYMLVSGRWFSAPDFTGPWTFATPNAPCGFQATSPSSTTRSRVLASVPGTTQAAEAILLAQIPQTASVSKTLEPPEIAYQGGTPQFQPIERTTVERAVNTDKDILKVGDLYYMCFQGVWFMSRTPTGPWKVTGEVPKAIYEIPVELAVPRRHVRHGAGVEQRRGGLRHGGGVHRRDGGLGLRRLGQRLLLPAVRLVRRRVSHLLSLTIRRYGFGASYNPWTGAYTRGAVAYGPYGGAGVAQRYNPRTGTYSRGAVAYGPYGARGAAQAYNPRTGAYGATRQGSNVYGSWGSDRRPARRSSGRRRRGTPAT